jgi:SCY1-like protein 1
LSSLSPLLYLEPVPAPLTSFPLCTQQVAPRLQESIRLRVIVPAFLKAMKDPFAYARLAAVRATSACREFYEPNLLVAKLLPEICPLLLDPYGPVRDAAASASGSSSL